MFEQQTRAFARHALRPKRPAAVKPCLPANLAQVAPFAFGPVMPAERQALDLIVATADLIDTPAGQFFLVPADPALVEALAVYGARAEDREPDNDDEAQEGENSGPDILNGPDRDRSDADFEC